MRKILTAAALAALTLSSPVLAKDKLSPDAELAKLLQGRVAGKPVNCINPTNAWSTRIVEGKAIVYQVGGTLYVNQPRSGAENLSDDDILVTRIYGSQLCSIDSIRLVDRYSGFPRNFVILDKFVPYAKPKAGRTS
ncbi:hypothetical protein [Sphingomonas aracearum]|uniref:Uncharacterized protein n=1 Tax=Sphingomonas aracearum TaxID=2283317 RepID=A0A369VVA1_9SPHN|nr:hypothetical protein [Sphingomonas aracearum]RDE05100.1 hypothetical protein DVW87_07390 [Sphingomonas aracearum]